MSRESRFDNLVDAVEDRLGLATTWEAFRDRLVHGGVRLRHVFPAVILYLFLQQAVLGVVLATYYAPTATDAWASTAYIQDQVTMGWFVRGVHYHGTSVLIVVIGLWLAQMVLHRAYKAPREFTWWAGIGMFGLALALGLTGNPLPWDQEGFWDIQVELSIAEQTPGGDIIRMLVQGGSDAGNLSILRLYVLHVFVLPGAFTGLLWLVPRQRAQAPDPPQRGVKARIGCRHPCQPPGPQLAQGLPRRGVDAHVEPVGIAQPCRQFDGVDLRAAKFEPVRKDQEPHTRARSLCPFPDARTPRGAKGPGAVWKCLNRSIACAPDR